MLTHRVKMNSGSALVEELTRITEVKIHPPVSQKDNGPGEIISIAPDSDKSASDGENDANSSPSHISNNRPVLTAVSDVVVGLPMVKTFESLDTTFHIDCAIAA